MGSARWHLKQAKEVLFLLCIAKQCPFLTQPRSTFLSFSETFCFAEQVGTRSALPEKHALPHSTGREELSETLGLGIHQSQQEDDIFLTPN